MFNSEANISKRLWCLVFVYVCIVSLMVQFIILPYIFPALHAGGGFFIGTPDCLGFYRLAVAMSDQIKTVGWGAWELRPQLQAPAGLAALVYVFLPGKLWVLIPINAVIHATAVVALFQIMRLFVKDPFKAFFCVLPLFIFPSNLQWVTQWHKDGFSILGMLLCLTGIVSFSKVENYQARGWFYNNIYSSVLFVCGCILIWIERPFILTVITPIIGVLFFMIALFYFIRALKKSISWQKVAATLFLLFFLFFALTQVKTIFSSNNTIDLLSADTLMEKQGTAAPSVMQMPAIERVRTEGVVVENKDAVEKLDVVKASVAVEALPIEKGIKKVGHKKEIENEFIEINWVRTSWLSSFIENKLHLLAFVRRGYRFSYPEAASNIDNMVGFGSAKDVLSYLPRAAQIVFFAPFPEQWLRKGGSSTGSLLMRRVSAFEMLVTYFALIFLPYALWHWRKRIEIWMIFIFCTYMMIVYGLVMCNVGSLYRMRYGYLMILVALGIAGFMVFLERLKIMK